jgi:hypothetical protein
VRQFLPQPSPSNNHPSTSSRTHPLHQHLISSLSYRPNHLLKLFQSAPLRSFHLRPTP